VGLQVHTALDLELQATVVAAGQFAVDAHYERQGRRALASPLADVASYLAVRQGLAAPVEGDCIDVVVPRTRRLDGLLFGSHIVRLQRSDRSARIRLPDPDFPSQSLSTVVQSGHVLSGCITEAGELALAGQPWAQSAVVVIENETGQVLAMSGGTDVVLEGFVRATQALRQPGSSFKPYVYATALRDGASQLDVMTDSPLSLPAGGGKLWSPKNYGGGFSGSMTLRQALARSVNTIAVRLALSVGVDEVVGVANGLGISTPLRRDPTIALGSSEVTPMDQAVAYATIARDGVPIQPVYITWVDGNDEIVDVVAGESQLIGNSVLTLPGARGEPVLTPAVAYETRDMLRQVVRGGTARSAYIPGMDRAGKTGTTNDNVDAWFVGMTRNHTIAVWVGTDGTGSLGKSETGGRAALPSWRMVADALNEPEGLAASPPSIAWWQYGGDWIALTRGQAPTSVVNPRMTPANEPLPEFVP
jgi:penicillin-binding protein 1A